MSPTSKKIAASMDRLNLLYTASDCFGLEVVEVLWMGPWSTDSHSPPHSHFSLFYFSCYFGNSNFRWHTDTHPTLFLIFSSCPVNSLLKFFFSPQLVWLLFRLRERMLGWRFSQSSGSGGTELLTSWQTDTLGSLCAAALLSNCLTCLQLSTYYQ